MQEFQQLNEQYFAEVTKAVNALVDSKVAVHAHDKILDDQIDDFQSRLVSQCSPRYGYSPRTRAFVPNVMASLPPPLAQGCLTLTTAAAV